jgi:hypothetical protein
VSDDKDPAKRRLADDEKSPLANRMADVWKGRRQHIVEDRRCLSKVDAVRLEILPRLAPDPT